MRGRNLRRTLVAVGLVAASAVLFTALCTSGYTCGVLGSTPFLFSCFRLF